MAVVQGSYFGGGLGWSVTSEPVGSPLTTPSPDHNLDQVEPFACRAPYLANYPLKDAI